MSEKIQIKIKIMLILPQKMFDNYILAKKVPNIFARMAPKIKKSIRPLF